MLTLKDTQTGEVLDNHTSKATGSSCSERRTMPSAAP